MPLPAPKGEIKLENMQFTPPGAKHPILKGISLQVEPGVHVAVLGPSAAGKSTLVRAILGIYRPEKGSVRLDGAEIHHWDRRQLGTYIGYLPQDVELMDGTISENIARFGEIDPEKVVEAAKAAGIHEMILHLPDGYDTRLAGGHILSIGQRQRVGIARAVYGDPRVIVLDEPNSNLDQAGDAALANTLMNLKKKGITVIVVTHRPNILGHVDKILLLVDGQSAFFGPRDEGLALLTQGAQRPATPPQQPAPAAPAPQPQPVKTTTMGTIASGPFR
jgi:ATP-binding cassette subfamily C protein EexD